MTTTTTRRPAVTLHRTGTFSFYLPATSTWSDAAIWACAEAADAVVLKGLAGPERVAGMRQAGWQGAALFDAAAYDPSTGDLHADKWFAAQAGAGADRLLTPGRLVPWDPGLDGIKAAVDAEWRVGEVSPGSTLVFAIDYRWLTKGVYAACEALLSPDRPVALILAHDKDPLSARGAVAGMISLTKSLPNLTILRCDHGAIGAVAAGATHGSAGLQATYRHFTQRGYVNLDDRTPRVFVEDLLSWYTAGKIAGWGASQVNMNCPRPCCEGAALERFHNPAHKHDAMLHNRTVIAGVADDILNAPPRERLQRWARLCREALAHYGPQGKFSEIIQPKAHLEEWAATVTV